MVYPNRVFIEDVPASTPAFREDRRPDQSNWNFKSLYKMSIPQYKRVRDACVGRLDGKVIYLDKKSKQQKEVMRYHTKESRKLLYSASDYVVMAGSDKRKGFFERLMDVPEDFISIAKEPEKKDNEVNPLGIYDASTALYLQGKYPKKGPDSPPKPTEQTKEEVIRGRTTNYNARLYDEPNNIPLWLEFVQFQEESSEYRLLERSKEDHEKKAKADRSIWEIQAAILEKALDKNPGCVMLKMAQLELSERQFADTEDLQQQWKNAVFTLINHPVVWMRYEILSLVSD